MIVSKHNYVILSPPLFAVWQQYATITFSFFQAAVKASCAAARLQNINCTVHITRRLGRWERVPPPGGSPGPQCSLVGPVRMTESFTGPIITLRSCPAASGPLSTCVARPLSSRSAPGEALPRPGGANRLHGSRRGGGACSSTVLDSLQFSDETQQIHASPRGKRKEGIVSLEAAAPGRGIRQDSRPSDASIPGSRDPIWQYGPVS